MKTNNAFIQFCKKSFFLLFLTITLTACPWDNDSGGGGVPPEKATVQGIATKGILKGATVNVYGVESGVVSQSLATTTTSDTGTYSVTIPEAYSGPVLIEIRNNADSDATMICDYYQCRGPYARFYRFGEDMPMGNLVLRTYVGMVTAGSMQSASVTPLTTMAAAYADDLAASNGGLDSTLIDMANSKVSNLFGINNIVITPAPDITGTASGTKNELKHAYLSAAVLGVANQHYSGDIETMMEHLVTDYQRNGGELLHRESYYNYQGVISLTDLALAATNIALDNIAYFNNENETVAMAEAFSDLWALYIVASAPSNIGQLTQTLPSPTSGANRLAIVKAFVADVRTWGNIIYTQKDWRAEYFQYQIDASTLLYDTSGPLLEHALNNTLKVAREAYISGQSVNLATYFASRSIPATGTATLTGNSVSVVGTINYTSVNVQLDFPDELNTTSFTLTINHGVVENHMARIEIASGDVTLNYGDTIDITPWLDGSNTTELPDPDSGSMSLEVSFTEKNKYDPLSMSGSLNLNLVGAQGGSGVIRDSFGDVVQYNPESLSMSCKVSNSTGDSYGVVISATMANAGTFMPQANQAESESSYRDIRNISVSASAKFIYLPEATFTLSGARTGFDDGNASLKIAYVGRSIEIDTSIIDGSASGSVSVVNQDGAVLHTNLTGGSILGNITYDGTVYARISDANGVKIIRYNDGSFESL